MKKVITIANRRMFNKQITNSDDFLEMPVSSQCLYFHLSMNADDDGFVNNWRSIIKLTGTKEDDLKVLVAKQFIIPFESGVIIIRHWRLNNYLRSDRYTETTHQIEMSKILLDENMVYQMDTNCLPLGDTDKIRLDKISKDKKRQVKSAKQVLSEEFDKDMKDIFGDENV